MLIDKNYTNNVFLTRQGNNILFLNEKLCVPFTV